MIDFLRTKKVKTKKVKDVFNKANKIDFAYKIFATTDAQNISLTTDTDHFGCPAPDKGRFWLKITDKKKVIPLNNVLLKVYINIEFCEVEIQKYRSLKLDPEAALDCFKKVIGFEDKTR